MVVMPALATVAAKEEINLTSNLAAKLMVLMCMFEKRHFAAQVPGKIGPIGGQSS